jgi:hypothetical protein
MHTPAPLPPNDAPAKLFKNWPSYEETTSCLNCNTEDTRYYSTLLANLSTDTLDFLEDVVNSQLEPKSITCTNCNKNTETKQIILKQQLIIETVASFSIQIQKNNFEVTVSLQNIPKNLQTYKCKYNLRGIITFIPPVFQSPLAIGYFVNYNWREQNNTWERYDDTTTKEKTVR